MLLLQYTGNSENVISETDDLAITRRKLFEHLKGTQLNVVLCNWVRSHSAHTFLLRAENGLLSFGMHAGPHDRGKIVINVLVGAFFVFYVVYKYVCLLCSSPSFITSGRCRSIYTTIAAINISIKNWGVPTTHSQAGFVFLQEDPHYDVAAPSSFSLNASTTGCVSQKIGIVLVCARTRGVCLQGGTLSESVVQYLA